jgi:hypothetical protein
MKRETHRYIPIALALCLCGAERGAWADEIVDVSVNTSSLQGQAGSEVFFELTDGSGTGNGNNTATMSSFALGGGAVGAVDPFSTFGGASGGMGSSVSITDTSPDNQFAQLLTPGATLSFKLDLTTFVEPAGFAPDGLFMFMTDPNGNSIASTSDPSGFNSLLAVTFNSATPSLTNFDSSLVSITSGAPAAAPEMDPHSAMSGLIFLAGCLAVLLARRRR